MKCWNFENKLAAGAALILTLVQFLVLPFLGQVDIAAKQYVFIFGIIFLWGFFFLRRDRLVVPASTPLFALWLLLLVASSFQAHRPYDAFLSLSVLAAGVSFMVLVAHLVRSTPSLGPGLVDFLLLVGTGSAVLGFYQLTHFLALGQSERALIPNMLPPLLFGRVNGTYGQANLFALLLTLCLLAYFFRYLHGPSQLQGSRFSAFRFIPVFLTGLVFFLADSRAGLLSFLLTFGFLLLLAVNGRYLSADPGRKREFFRLVLCLSASFLIARMLARMIAGDLSLGVEAMEEVRGMNMDSRFVFWTATAIVFLKNPLLGVGLENLKFVFPHHQILAHDWLGFVEYEAIMVSKWAHNELLQIFAEGGLLGGLFPLLMILLLVRNLWRFLRNTNEHAAPPLVLYGHLFLLPFIIQSMFEWPLRHPGLAPLFWALLGLLLAQFRVRELKFTRLVRSALAGLSVVSLVMAGLLFHKETKIGEFRDDLSKSGFPEEQFEVLESLGRDPYCEFPVLHKILPRFIQDAVERKDLERGNRLIPYAERIANLHGTDQQWYNLARLYERAGRWESSFAAVQKAIDLRPVNMAAWNFQHYLNMQKASRETGMPIESFYPKEGLPILPTEIPHGRN